MRNPDTDRRALEELWLGRLNQARLRVELARSFLREIHQDSQNGTMPQPDGDYAFRRAIQGESSALAEYSRVLRVYHDLTVNGRLPEDADWPHHRAVGNAGGEGN